MAWKTESRFAASMLARSYCHGSTRIRTQNANTMAKKAPRSLSFHDFTHIGPITHREAGLHFPKRRKPSPHSTKTLEMACAASDTMFSSALSTVLSSLENIKSLKPEQETALEAFLMKKDVFAMLPTGFGKSLIYQLSPLVAKEMKLFPNPVVVVVSPLVALMEQQVVEASRLGIVAMQLGVNSYEEILNGKPQLLFGSPESWLLNRKWCGFLATMTELVGIVVDEVHLTYKCGCLCLAKGHLGSPDFSSIFYNMIMSLFEFPQLKQRKCMGLDETDLAARARVKRQLHLENATVITASPNRENVRLEVKSKGLSMSPVLIYCRTLKDTGRVFCYLKAELGDFAWINQDPQRNQENMLIGMFHSKTLADNKRRVLSSLSGEGNCRVIVATTALGMGLHFSSISHVVMYGLPDDLEAVVQQIGRAGRDGKQSHAIVYAITQHTRVDDTVKKLVQTCQKSCFRKFLFSYFEESVSVVEPGHLCCTYCHNKCQCHTDGCNQPMPVYETYERDILPQATRQVTEDDRVMLRQLLEEYRCTLLMEGTHLYTSTTACTGFGVELVQEIIEHSANIFDVNYIIQHLPVFQKKHAEDILLIINTVFKDVKCCPTTSTTPVAIPPLDIDYTGYVDKDNFDQDCEDTPSDTSPVSGVTSLEPSD
uniref:DNA 3'-5' helicase n=1 Tax=Neogobius melanostomus TaxID=47308 RepID=A0A8C6WTJ5_9GOBI